MTLKQKRVVQVVLLLLAFLCIVPRLWLQFKPIPIYMTVIRPVTQADWEKMTKSTSLMPTNITTIEEQFIYPQKDKHIFLSFWDIQTIRAKASWGTLFPYRIEALKVRSLTNASLMVYERHTTELEFTKNRSGWRMEPHGGSICWASESAKPTVSFH